MVCERRPIASFSPQGTVACDNEQSLRYQLENGDVSRGKIYDGTFESAPSAGWDRTDIQSMILETSSTGSFSMTD